MEGDEPIFYGNSGQECEEFIRAVRKAGFQAQKIRDDAWMADYASTCLTGRALRYYETLSPEVQGDWRILRQALLKEYPLAEPDNSSAQAGGSTTSQAPTPAAAAPTPAAATPTPATAAPAPSQNKRGRIKVKGTDGSDLGYLGFGTTATTSRLGAGFTQAKALSISYAPVSLPFEIDIEKSSGKRQVLGVQWGTTPQSTGVRPNDYAAVTAFDCDGSNRSSGMDWSGPAHAPVWRVMSDNTLVAHWKNGMVDSGLTYIILTTGSYEGHAIDAVSDTNTFCTPGGWKPATLVVEPLT